LEKRIRGVCDSADQKPEMDFDVYRERKKYLYSRIASFEGGTHEENIEEEDRERDGKEG